MNTSALLLHALKGTCALNCLAALHLAGPQPVTHRTVMQLTGFDDSAVRKGLNTLLVLGLVSCTGNEHRTAWQLLPEAGRLPLVLDPVLPIPQKWESEILKEEEKEREEESESDSDFNLDLAVDFEEAVEPVSETAPGVTEPAAPAALPPPANLNPAPPSLPAPPAESAPPPRPVGRKLRWDTPAEKILRGQFYDIFEAVNVYLQIRRPLTDELLDEDGPAWLRQALGWLCYAQRQLPHVKRGAVVCISLRDRLPCDPAYLPPPELVFTEALAWALRGGEAARPPDDEADGDDSRNAPAPAPAALESPEARLWQAVVAQLALELPRAVIDAQLRPARLAALGPERCTLVVPTPQSRDWLALRLKPVLARALRELTGRVLAIDIEADG